MWKKLRIKFQDKLNGIIDSKEQTSFIQSVQLIMINSTITWQSVPTVIPSQRPFPLMPTQKPNIAASGMPTK